jgi:uncharacterized RDD family membrane protein YckC
MSDEQTDSSSEDLPVPSNVTPPAFDGQAAYVPPAWEVPDSVPSDIEGRYAGYGWRVLGYLIDAIVLGIVLGIFSRLLGIGLYGDFAVGFVARALYAGILISYWNGQTLGMKALKLVCVDSRSRAQIPLAQSLIRAFTAEIIAALSLFGAVFGVAQLLDLLWPAWDKKNQTLHDKVGKTIVLR